MSTQGEAFQDMPDLFKGARIFKFPKGEIIQRPGEEPRGVYRIVTGLIKVYAINNQGEDYIHIIYGPGELFPLSSLLGDSAARSVFYGAMTDCEVSCITLSTFFEKLHSDTEFTYGILGQTLKQFNIYADRVDNLEYKFARERLAYRLLFIGSRFGEKTTEGLRLPQLTQKDLASTINLSRESVTREIERLRQLGVIRYEKDIIIITDIQRLGKEINGGATHNLWGLLDRVK